MNSLFIIPPATSLTFSLALSFSTHFALVRNPPPPCMCHPRNSAIPPEAIHSPIIRRAISPRDAGGALIHLISVIAGSSAPPRRATDKK